MLYNVVRNNARCAHIVKSLPSPRVSNANAIGDITSSRVIGKGNGKIGDARPWRHGIQ